MKYSKDRSGFHVEIVDFGKKFTIGRNLCGWCRRPADRADKRRSVRTAACCGGGGREAYSGAIMAMLKRIYRLLRPINDPVVDRAMAEALPTADAEAQHLLVLSLFSRRDESARMALVQYLHLLAPGLQELVVGHVRELDSVIRAAAEHREPMTRLNVVDLVVRSQSFRLAYLMSAQLHHDESRVRKAAALGLLNLAHLVEEGAAGVEGAAAAGGGGGVRAGDGAAPPGATRVQRVRWLALAIAEGCACYHQHGRADLLAAAASLGPAQPRQLLQLLTDRRNAAHAALREMIRHAERPEIQASLLVYGCLAGLEPMVVESLSRPESAQHLPLIWKHAHLLAVPDARSAVRKVTGGRHLLPTEAVLVDLPVAMVRLTPRWVTAVRADRVEQVAALKPLAESEDRETRLLALRALREMPDPVADEQVAAMCFDTEPAIARIALRHLRKRQWDGMIRHVVRLIGSPHASVRALVERELAPVGFQRLWRHWDQMDASTQQSAGRAVLKIDRRFDEQLTEKLAAADAAERFRAVGLIRALELASRHKDRLLELMADADKRVASSAAKALAMVEDSPEVAQRLSDTLEDDDDRVRANAIESLEALGHVQQANARLRELAGRAEAGNRTRAAAIRALMKLPMGQAMPELARMLSDERPEHRASALWVVEQLGMADLARQVVEVARGDGDREIRRRALGVYRGILRKHETRGRTGGEG